MPGFWDKLKTKVADKMPSKGKVQWGTADHELLEYEVLTHVPAKKNKGKVSFATFDIDDMLIIDDVTDVGYKKKSLKPMTIGTGNKAITILNKGKGSQDSVIRTAIREAEYMHGRTWKKPQCASATVSAIGGAGKLTEELINRLSGAKPRVKEEVPLGPKNWSKYCTALYTGICCEPIPVIGQVVTPIAAIIQARAEGKGFGSSAKDGGAAFAASTVDGVLSVVTLGGYTLYAEISAQVVAALTIMLKAYQYHSGWKETQVQIQKKIDKIKKAMKTVDEECVSQKVWDEALDKIIQLERYKDQCAKYGPMYKKFYDDAKQNLADAANAAKKKMGGGKDAELADYMDTMANYD